MWGGKKNWADMLKQPQAPATTLPPSGSLQAPIPDSSQNDVVSPDPQLVWLLLQITELHCADMMACGVRAMMLTHMEDMTSACVSTGGLVNS